MWNVPTSNTQFRKYKLTCQEIMDLDLDFWNNEAIPLIQDAEVEVADDRELSPTDKWKYMAQTAANLLKTLENR